MPAATTNENVETVVADALVRFGAPAQAISRNASFEALEVDSLDLFELAQIIDEQFGVEVTGNDVKGIATIGDLVDLVVTRST